MGTRWQTERGGWRWGRQKDGEVLCEPLWGNVMCKRCLFIQVYRCLDRVKYVYMYKIIFLPTGSPRHEPVASHGSQKWRISLWCISHLCVGLQPPSFPEEGETLQLQLWELGGLVGLLAWLTDLSCLHLSYIQCWISASEGISCHTDMEGRDAAGLALGETDTGSVLTTCNWFLSHWILGLIRFSLKKITFVYNDLGKRRQLSDLFVCSGLSTVSFLKSFSPKKSQTLERVERIMYGKSAGRDLHWHVTLFQFATYRALHL